MNHTISVINAVIIVTGFNATERPVLFPLYDARSRQSHYRRVFRIPIPPTPRYGSLFPIEGPISEARELVQTSPGMRVVRRRVLAGGRPIALFPMRILQRIAARGAGVSFRLAALAPKMISALPHIQTVRPPIALLSGRPEIHLPIDVIAHWAISKREACVATRTPHRYWGGFPDLFVSVGKRVRAAP